MDLQRSVRAVFAGVNVAVVRSEELNEAIATEIIHRIELHGGTHRDLATESLDQITHIVSTTSKFPAFQTAVDAFIHVVRPHWVEHSILKNKLVNTRAFTPDSRMFLSNLYLTFGTDVPSGHQDALMKVVSYFGGQHSPKLTKTCTHIIALSTENEVCKFARERRLRIPIVLPQWLEGCLESCRLIDLDPYQLPDTSAVRPDIVSSEGNAAELATTDDDQAISPALRDLQIQTCQRTVFQSHAIFIDENLGISDHFRAVLASLIVASQGQVASAIDKADTLVCRFRTGHNYAYAVQQGLNIANLTWFFHEINWNAWTLPTDRLLHYPIPKSGLEGFRSLRIGVSNYSGEARIYLENLICAAGSIFTKTLTEDNTHLITAHANSDKVDAAKEWNIHIVNHLWLEESYSKCKMQSVADAAYIPLPISTTSRNAIGQTRLDSKALRKKYGISARSSIKSTSTASDGQKTSHSSRQLIDTESSLTEHTPKSRGAKDRAIDKLHQLAPDMAAFEKETRRVGGVVYGGRRVNDPDRIAISHSSGGRKRSRELSSDNGINSSDRNNTLGNFKRARPSQLPDQLNVIITALNDELSEADIRRFKNIPGIRYMADVPHFPSKKIIDILVAPCVKRTIKFFFAIAHGAQVVTQDWVRHVLRTGKSDDAAKFTLKNATIEKQPSVVLEDCLKRGKELRAKGGLLKGWTVFCTCGVKGGPDMMQDIVEANGGTLVVFKGKRVAAPAIGQRKRAKVEKVADASDPRQKDPGKPVECHHQRLFCLTVKQDEHDWHHFHDVAVEGGYRPCLVQTEWLLQVAMAQDLSLWQADWEWDIGTAIMAKAQE